ncbi:cysteine--1-D-myo-inosityl 2-amino-2-deoxy-alpha-D-glucopyranoside ligase [Sinomonas sp. ASV322]|uniref:cysteine--1-D-myo-inosityl 2-amino-2-deoxy-alpha-D-glucopyranoside ligase n=1 Tax=Sinomonas sp. ASV322 TaxID=3041920 RepID=UPI0027DD7FDA|nr:cysteine--1-D-myo-inosityl 2-amino-2-deoxy-alpha-D-glucopyranoside ligase [Sinomonas sp. ASV322]MDQ4501017.1 cysteine--1-D-myo-inosityl 2-amino-2-deoxy-alpha-D-glucopyranoside ligase [Sinomonas sp. ASV322]
MKTWRQAPVPPLPGRSGSIRLWDSARGELAELPTAAEQSVYVCGITPYDATHLGHAATYVAFDVLNRVWRDAGSAVAYVQNTTDVDDPLLERADATGVDWRTLAKEQIALFQADMEALNVLPPDHYIGAVESIPWIVPEVERLLDEGLAYQLAGSEGEPDGDIYYDVTEATRRADLPEAWRLGQVSHLTVAEMISVFGERGGDPERPGKHSPLDPILWREARLGEPHWDGGTLGRGRPGWHIECTVIAQRFLPAPFTVQGGGSDLAFPHHEMGAGHAWSLHHVPLARHFAHTGMVGLDGQKMSKSLGNLVLVSKLRAAGEEPQAIRLAILANHYRSDWEWTAELFDASKARLAHWRDAIPHAPLGSGELLLAEIRKALADDLDAPRALAAVDKWADDALAGGDSEPADGALVTAVLDALLGVRL